MPTLVRPTNFDSVGNAAVNNKDDLAYVKGLVLQINDQGKAGWPTPGERSQINPTSLVCEPELISCLARMQTLNVPSEAPSGGRVVRYSRSLPMLEKSAADCASAVPTFTGNVPIRGLQPVGVMQPQLDTDPIPLDFLEKLKPHVTTIEVGANWGVSGGGAVFGGGFGSIEFKDRGESRKLTLVAASVGASFAPGSFQFSLPTESFPSGLVGSVCRGFNQGTLSIDDLESMFIAFCINVNLPNGAWSVTLYCMGFSAGDQAILAGALPIAWPKAMNARAFMVMYGKAVAAFPMDGGGQMQIGYLISPTTVDAIATAPAPRPKYR